MDSFSLVRACLTLALTGTLLAAGVTPASSTTVLPAGRAAALRVIAGASPEVGVTVSPHVDGTCDGVSAPVGSIPAAPANQAVGELLLPLSSPTNADCTPTAGAAFEVSWSGGWTLGVTWWSPIASTLTFPAGGMTVRVPSLACEATTSAATILRGTFRNGGLGTFSTVSLAGASASVVWRSVFPGSCPTAGVATTIRFPFATFNAVSNDTATGNRIIVNP